MGNSDIRDLATITKSSLDDLSGAVVTVDAHNWLYKYLTTTVQYTNKKAYTTDSGTELPTVIGAIQGAKRFLEHELTPIFVFDGEAHALKEEEIKRRADKKRKAKELQTEAQKQGNTIEASKYKSRSARLTPQMVAETKQILDYLDFSYITAPSAGESQGAYMAQNNTDIYGLISDDYDSVLFESPYTIRNFTSKRSIEQISLSETLNNLDVSHYELVEAAVLCGTDYNSGIHGYGPKTSIKAVQQKSFEDILAENLDPQEAELYCEVRDIFMHPDTTQSYSISTDRPQPDVEKIYEYFSESGLSIDLVDTSLDDITEYATQSGLSQWS